MFFFFRPKNSFWVTLFIFWGTLSQVFSVGNTKKRSSADSSEEVAAKKRLSQKDEEKNKEDVLLAARSLPKKVVRIEADLQKSSLFKAFQQAASKKANKNAFVEFVRKFDPSKYDERELKLLQLFLSLIFPRDTEYEHFTKKNLIKLVGITDKYGMVNCWTLKNLKNHDLKHIDIESEEDGSDGGSSYNTIMEEDFDEKKNQENYQTIFDKINVHLFKKTNIYKPFLKAVKSEGDINLFPINEYNKSDLEQFHLILRSILDPADSGFRTYSCTYEQPSNVANDLGIGFSLNDHDGECYFLRGRVYSHLKLLDSQFEKSDLFKAFQEVATSSSDDLDLAESRENILKLDLSGYKKIDLKRLGLILDNLSDKTAIEFGILDLDQATSDDKFSAYDLLSKRVRLLKRLDKDSNLFKTFLQVASNKDGVNVDVIIRNIKELNLINYSWVELKNLEYFLRAIQSSTFSFSTITTEFGIINQEQAKNAYGFLFQKARFFKTLDSKSVLFKAFLKAATTRGNVNNTIENIKKFGLNRHNKSDLSDLLEFLKFLERGECELRNQIVIDIGIISNEQANGAYEFLLQRVQEKFENLRKQEEEKDESSSSS